MAEVECPSCGQLLKVPEEQAGKQVRCPKCAGTFTASAPAGAAPPASRPPDYDDDNDAERDEQFERRASRGRGAPHRGGLILSFGIISIVLFLSSLGGAAAGASLGSMFGPIGTAGGAGLGALLSFL